MVLCKVKDPSELCLMVVCDRLTPSFLSQVELSRATLAEVEPGIWRGSFGGFTLHAVETGKACALAPSEYLLFTFSRTYLEAPGAVPPLDPADFRVYLWLYQQVEQFKRARGAMAVKDIETFEKGYQEALDELMGKMSIKVRLRGLTPEERLAGLTPEELIAGLTPEQVEQLKRLLH